MATVFNEAVVEVAALEWLAGIGWQVAHGPDIPNAERADYGQVAVEGRLRDALARLNPHWPGAALDDAFRKLTSWRGQRWMLATAPFTGCWSTARRWSIAPKMALSVATRL